MSTRDALPLPTEVDTLARVPFGFEDYLALPPSHRAEYADGSAVVSPSPSAAHQRIARRVANTVERHCPGLFVVCAVGVRTGERRRRIPDVHATERPYDGSWSDQVPVLVVEVLSPSTRREDTLRKSAEYLDAGIGQYWIVDREHRTFTVLRAGTTGWEVLLDLDDANPSGTVPVGASGVHGTVILDLGELLAA